MPLSMFGTKNEKIIMKYPSPKNNIIIEPFAGMAGYSLYYFYKAIIILNDLYPVISGIWNYLVNATPEQILNLPSLKKGDDIRDLDIPQVEKNLLGFMVSRGISSPNNIYTGWAADSNEIERRKRKIIKILNNIRHFKITNRRYQDIPNTKVEATWFIDPPYQNGGEHYVYNQIDYEELAEWCKSRNGQVIVCENSDANWLDFKPLFELQGQRKRTTELIWTKG